MRLANYVTEGVDHLSPSTRMLIIGGATLLAIGGFVAYCVVSRRRGKPTDTSSRLDD